MNVLLINPPYDVKRYMGGLSKIGWLFPPIGLTYIAAYLRTHLPGCQVKIYDSQVEQISLARVIKEFSPEVVGITCQTALVYSTLETAAFIKQIKPKTLMVTGGVHPSLRPEDLLQNKKIDLVVCGEGEVTFLEICRQRLSRKDDYSMPGISRLDGNGQISHHPSRPLLQDLHQIPMPALDLVPLEKYRISPDLKTGDRLGLILTARGCPFNCIFCANRLLTRQTYRARPIDDVLTEIDYYLENYQVDQLMIIDDNFAVDRKRTLELCHQFISRGYPKKFNWWAQARVDCLDEELLYLMKKAGCSILSLGLESGNQRLLDLIKKNITLEQIKKTVDLIKKVGIKSRASLILGLPTETTRESRQTIRFAYRLPLDQVRFSIATPFPGTQLWDIAVKEQRINPDKIDWTQLSLMGGYAGYDPVYAPKGRSPKEIKRLQLRANLFFFLRPRIILGYIKRARSIGDVLYLMKGFIHFLNSTFFTRGRS